MLLKRYERPLVWLLIFGHTLLAGGFSLGPLFERPDEFAHYLYVEYIAQHGALPDPAGRVRSEFHQPPLYYLLSAPLVALLGNNGLDEINQRRNPFYGRVFERRSNDNRNSYLHPRAELFPNLGTEVARSVHTIRLLSVLMGAATVWLVYRLSWLLWPETAAWRVLSVGLVAFIPEFLFMTGSVSNDPLVYLLATLSLYLLLRYQRTGLTTRKALLVGLTLGAALLAKTSAGFLVLPVGLALMRNRQWWRFVPVIAGCVLLVAGWWYGRNLLLYGDPTNVRAWEQTWVEDRIEPGTLTFLDVITQRLPFTYKTLWLNFHGVATINDPVRPVFDVLTLLALAGLAGRVIFQIARRSQPPEDVLPTRDSLILAAFALGWLLATLYLARIAWNGNQGRYLLPGVAAWGVFWFMASASGWFHVSGSWPWWGFSCSGSGLAAFTVSGIYFAAFAITPTPSMCHRAWLTTSKMWRNW
jgi:4-amino-4-deoxy-L-arabinose transferase-like glycosyltransferase